MAVSTSTNRRFQARLLKIRDFGPLGHHAEQRRGVPAGTGSLRNQGPSGPGAAQIRSHLAAIFCQFLLLWPVFTSFKGFDRVLINIWFLYGCSMVFIGLNRVS